MQKLKCFDARPTPKGVFPYISLASIFAPRFSKYKEHIDAPLLEA